MFNWCLVGGYLLSIVKFEVYKLGCSCCHGFIGGKVDLFKHKGVVYSPQIFWVCISFGEKMNKIVVTGLSEISIKNIQSLLVESGMKHALPSRMEQLSASDIMKTICLAHGLNLKNPEIVQVDVSPVWNNLLMDLMLANCQQEIWGWADKNVIYLLDYLKKQDTSFLFVLVYESPESIFSNNTEDYTDQNDFHKRAQQWANYNTVLLDFYTKNQDRCLLVNIDDIENSVVDFIAKIGEKLVIQGQVDLIESDQIEIANVVQVEQEIIFSEKKSRVSARRQKKMLKDKELKKHSLVQKKTEHKALLNFSNEIKSDFVSTQKKSDLRDYFSKVLISQQQELNLNTLYNTLQKSSDLKITQQKALLGSNQLFELWNEVVGLEAILNENEENLLIQDHKISNLELEKDQLKALILNSEEQLYAVKQDRDIKIQLLEKQKDELEVAKNATVYLDQINELTIAKTEIEKKANWRAGRTTQLTKDNEKVVNDLKIQQGEMNRLEAVIQQLQDIDQVQLHKQENELRLFQLAQLKEELDGYYIQIHNNKKNAVNKVIHEKNESLNIHLYGAADRIKQDLPYQLGKTMIDHSRSLNGVVTLPLALYRQKQKFEQIDASKLPAIESYNDHYEAEKVKRHLSFKLGQAVVENVGELSSWLKIPVSLSKVLIEHKRKKVK